MNVSLNDYKPLIYSLVKNQWVKNKYSRPDVSFEELLSEAYFIYSWCLHNYNEKKNAKFITYLYTNLKGRLVDYYNFAHKPFSLYEDVAAEDCKEGYESCISSADYDISKTTFDIFTDGKKYLSYDGYQVMKYILSRDWENNNENCKRKNKKPTTRQIAEKFRYSPQVVDSIMMELKLFWNDNWKYYN